MKRRHKKNRFNYQALESRQMLAGNVTVSLNEGLLEINGDALANEIQIIGNADGTARVTATTGTTINGATTAFVANTSLSDVVVRLNAGNDALRINGLVLSSELTLDMGEGNDSLIISDINVRNLDVVAGAGNDSLQFHNTFSHRNAVINGGAGDDTLSITAMATDSFLDIDLAPAPTLLQSIILGSARSSF